MAGNGLPTDLTTRVPTVCRPGVVWSNYRRNRGDRRFLGVLCSRSVFYQSLPPSRLLLSEGPVRGPPQPVWRHLPSPEVSVCPTVDRRGGGGGSPCVFPEIRARLVNRDRPVRRGGRGVRRPAGRAEFECVSGHTGSDRSLLGLVSLDLSSFPGTPPPHSTPSRRRSEMSLPRSSRVL